MRFTAIALAIIAGTVSSASAGEGEPCPDCTTITFDAGAGNVDAVLTTFLGDDEPIMLPVTVEGSAVIESTDFVMPTQVSLHELSISINPAADIDDAVNFDDPGGPTILGSLDYAAVFSDAFWAAGGMNLTEGQGFTFGDIPMMLTGNYSADYHSMIVIGDGDTAGNLADIDPMSNPATLSSVLISSDGETVTMSCTLDLGFTVPYEPFLVELNVDLSAGLTGTGVDPHDDNGGPNYCSRADIAEPCGVLDLADLTTFIQAFQAGEPLADIVEPFGTYDLADLTTFIQIFQANECSGIDKEGDNPYDCYYIVEFPTGNSTYALGEHRILTAGLAVAGMALMLGFSSLRRRA